MDSLIQLTRKKTDLLAQLAALGPMRKGSLTEQYVQATLKNGVQSQRGPYTLYTFKEKGRTVSRRLSDRDQIARYREQIDAFRRFQALTGELAQFSQRLADLEAVEATEGKKNSRR
jgi:hypothetical protein